MDYKANILLLFIPISGLLGILVYFVNKEIKKTKDFIDASERMIRDKFEKDMQENNKKIVDEHHERFHEMSRLAEFGKLSKGLFHDLINPLSAVILYTKNLERMNNKDFKMNKMAIENAIGASERMALHMENIQSILKHEDRARICSFKEELSRVLSILSYRLKENNIVAKTNLKDDYIWFGNPTQIEHIYLNLISNSIDSLEKMKGGDSRRIEIKTYIEKPDFNMTISDNGPGIESANISKIFKPFFTTKEKNKGIGIGLTMIKSIIEEKMNGKITVYNNIDRGVTFKVSLPL